MPYSLTTSALLLFPLAALFGCAANEPIAPPSPQPFEAEIAAFEELDRHAPSTPGVIVFAGSSSIRMWSTLGADMRPLQVLNRGFGGSQLSQLNGYIERILAAHEPGAIVVYEGDNDLAAGSQKTPESVAADFRKLVERVRALHEDLPVYFIAIKPSTARWEQWPAMARANELIEAHCAGDSNLGYLDVAAPMLNEQGEPSRELFLDDGLHMRAAGYEIWTEVIRPRLLQELEAAD